MKEFLKINIAFHSLLSLERKRFCLGFGAGFFEGRFFISILFIILSIRINKDY